MKKDHPPHPGRLLREDIMPALGITVTDAATQLGMSRVQLSRFINERASVTPELALRLGRWWPAQPAIRWLHMQGEHDLWQLERAGTANAVQPAAPAEPAPATDKPQPVEDPDADSGLEVWEL